MTDPINKKGCVALYATRIKYYANEIVRTHVLSGETGLDEAPWASAYQQKAAKIYTENLPTDYLETLAGVFLGCAQTMDAEPAPPDDLIEDWRIVHAYFDNGAEAIADVLDVNIEAKWEDPTDKAPTTPASVRFDILATYVTAQAAVRLRDAGASVAEHLGTLKPLTGKQLVILGDLAAGSTYIEVAGRHGFSSRTIDREVERICKRLEVEGRQQAITLAVHNGWI